MTLHLIAILKVTTSNTFPHNQIKLHLLEGSFPLRTTDLSIKISKYHAPHGTESHTAMRCNVSHRTEVIRGRAGSDGNSVAKILFTRYHIRNDCNI